MPLIKPFFFPFTSFRIKSEIMPYNQMNYKSKVKKTVHKNDGESGTRNYALD